MKSKFSEKMIKDMLMHPIVRSRALQMGLEDAVKSIRKELKEAIKGVKITNDIRKRYFEDLLKLIRKAKWKKFKPWGKFIFFKRWFIAVSDEYMKAFIKFHSIEAMQNKDNTKLRHVMDGGALFMYDLPLREDKRNYDLINEAPSHPPVTLSGSGLTEEWMYKRSQLDMSLRLCLIDIRFPMKTLLKEYEKYIKIEQRQYYLDNPEEYEIFMKQTKDGRQATYPFDEWERYLKVYILKKVGVTNRELIDLFYSSEAYTVTPIRQVIRDSQKARNLSQNAIARTLFVVKRIWTAELIPSYRSVIIS